MQLELLKITLTDFIKGNELAETLRADPWVPQNTVRIPDSDERVDETNPVGYLPMADSKAP